MKPFFLNKEYVALALIKSKDQFFHESFITIQELNQFIGFLQQEFNNQDLNIIISSNSLSEEDFNVTDEIIVKSNNCCFNLDLVPIKILKILYNIDFITDFWMKIEQEKLEVLENMRNTSFKLNRKVNR